MFAKRAVQNQAEDVKGRRDFFSRSFFSLSKCRLKNVHDLQHHAPTVSSLTAPRRFLTQALSAALVHQSSQCHTPTQVFVTGSSWELERGPQEGVRPVLDGFYWVGESWGRGDERQSGSNLVVGA